MSSPKLTKTKKSVDGETVHVFALPSGAYTCMKLEWIKDMEEQMKRAEKDNENG